MEFSADFYLLKPVDPARGNGRLFYEAGNRGTKRILPVFQNATNSTDPASAEEFGNGALMQQGFSPLWMGWQWDVPEGRMRMEMPIATNNGQPITGWVRGNLIPGANATTASVADRGHLAYPVVDPNSPEHRMIMRTLPTDTPKEIARSTWRFTGPGTVTLDRGFEAGLIHRVSRRGFLEAIYYEALALEFTRRKIPYVTQVPCSVEYKGQRLHGFYKLDFVCFGSVIVEVKASSAAAPADYAQVLNYLAVSGHQIALLLNLGRPSLEYRRFALSEEP